LQAIAHTLLDEKGNPLAPVVILTVSTPKLEDKTPRLTHDGAKKGESVQLASWLPASRSIAATRWTGAGGKCHGALVAFATQPNRVAADGEGRNSPFARALQHLAQASHN
jgi:hypothetical protein